MASRRNDLVVKGSKSHQTSFLWTIYPLAVKRDLWRWMLRPKTTVDWTWKLFLSLRPTNRFVCFYVFSSSLRSSLSYLSLTLYHVQLTACTFKWEKNIAESVLINYFYNYLILLEISLKSLVGKNSFLLQALNPINYSLLELSKVWHWIQTFVVEFWGLRRQ